MIAAALDDKGNAMGRIGPEWRNAAMLLALLFVACSATVGVGRAQQPTQQPTQQLTQQLGAPDADIDQRAAKARELTSLYREKLKAGIQNSIRESGVVGAIGACSTLAPELNATVTDATNFELARTAQRVRNPENTPDAWEQSILEQFQKSLESGAEAKTLETYDVVTTSEGQRLFRYMRPIMMGEPCMACHGPSVAPDVKAEIAKYYVDDKAIGYTVGEMRGAFSLVQHLD